MSTHRKLSRFLTIKCGACDNEQIVFSHSKLEVQCRICKESLASPTGGKAEIKGVIINVLS